LCVLQVAFRPCDEKAFRVPPEMAFAKPETPLAATIVFLAGGKYHPLGICVLKAS
jgi:hypothetical protein